MKIFLGMHVFVVHVFHLDLKQNCEEHKTHFKPRNKVSRFSAGLTSFPPILTEEK